VAEQLLTHSQHSENIQTTRKVCTTETLRLVSLHPVISFSPLWSHLQNSTTVVVITHLCRTYYLYFDVHFVKYIYHTQTSNIQFTALFCNWCLKNNILYKSCTDIHNLCQYQSLYSST